MIDRDFFSVYSEPSVVTCTSRINHGKHRIHGKFRTEVLANNSLVFDLRIVAEVDKEPNFISSGFQVVMNLCSMLVAELADGFDF